MTFIVLYEVCCRRLLNSPTSWAFDMTTYVFGAYFILGLGYVELHGRHIRIDIISQQLPKKIQTVVANFDLSGFFSAVCRLTHLGWSRARRRLVGHVGARSERLAAAHIPDQDHPADWSVSASDPGVFQLRKRHPETEGGRRP